MALAKNLLLAGSLAAAVAVALGAFGAHGLKKSLQPELLDVYRTAVQYHFYHALGLIVLGIAAGQLSSLVLLRLAGSAMFAGIILFSGSLYLLAITGQRWLGAITPLGGLAFIAAWLLFTFAVWKSL